MLLQSKVFIFKFVQLFLKHKHDYCHNYNTRTLSCYQNKMIRCRDKLVINEFDEDSIKSANLITYFNISPIHADTLTIHISFIT
jgi:hypothetical protein